VAGSRLFVQESRSEEVVDGVSEIAKSIKLGSGLDEGTQMGPLVSGEQFRRVTGFLESGKADGATALTGGGRFGDRGYFAEPTVLTNTHPDMKVVRDEIFGGRGRGPVPEPGRDRRGGQRHRLRPGRRDLDQGHLQGTRAGQETQGGHGLDQLLNVFDASLPFGRVQAVRLGP
jgi:phenylacetaldehyde dehydrogenase